MSIQTLINYLRITRSAEEAEAKSKHLLAMPIDKNYSPNNPLHEDDLILVSKTDIQQQNYLKNISDLIPNELYFVEVAQNRYKYYIKREQEVNGVITTDYCQVTSIITNSWETLSNQNLYKVTFNAAPNLYFNELTFQIIEVYLNNVIPFQDTLKYHPNDIYEVTDGEYTLDFKDADGFTNSGIDYFLKGLGNSQEEFLRSQQRRNVNFIKESRPGIITLFPRITERGNKYILQYNYYQRGIPAQSFLVDNALHLEFRYIGALLAFLNQTIFYELTEPSDFQGFKHREPFLNAYIDLIKSHAYYSITTEVLEILFFAPTFVIQQLKTDFLWHLIDTTLKSSLTNFQGVNTEDIVLKIIQVLAQKRGLEKQILQQLLAKSTANKTRLELLYDKIDGENNEKFVKLIYTIWKKTNYIIPNEKETKEFASTTGPLFLPYESKKWLGLYFSNAATSFANGMVQVAFETGKYALMPDPHSKAGETNKEIIAQYEYHPYYPIYIKNLEKQETTLELDVVVPAFMLFANQNKQFWHNVLTTAEYGVDILTTISGFGNLAKFRYLAKFASRAETLSFVSKTGKAVTQARAAVAAIAATIEITSGTVNALFKLTEINDTDIGKTIMEYLFWLELLSLSGELSVAIHKGLQKCAKEIVTNAEKRAKLEKELDILAQEGQITRKEADEVLEHLDEVAEAGIKRSIKQAKRIARTAKVGDVNKSFFENLDIVLKQEDSIGLISGQTKANTCVANSLRMVLDDLGIIKYEDTLAAALKTDDFGAKILDIPNALHNTHIEDIETIIRGGAKDINVEFSTLEKLMKNGKRKAVVSVFHEDFGAHAILVDKIEDSRVYVRDPLPLNIGSSYSLTVEDFKKFFNKKFVTIKVN